MSVYISGMEMPKEQNVPTWAVIFSNGEVRIYKDGFNTDQGNGKGTAIPIPPHGRLIDADAIPYNKIMLEDDDFYYGVTKPYIDRMPTIIPEDEVV